MDTGNTWSKVAIIFGILLEFILGSWGGILTYLIAIIYVGYSVGGDYINCAIHGALVGIIASIVVGILAFID